MTMAGAREGRFGIAFDWLGVERAWTRTRGSPSVIIGIIDHGVQADHPLIGPNIHPARGHTLATSGEHEILGTHAAGIAAGRQSDAASFSGVAPDARILPVRFSSTADTAALDLAHAIEYAAEMGASIINVSHAANLGQDAVRRAMQYAAARNALIVSPATSGFAGSEQDPVPNRLAVLSINERLEPLVNHVPDAAHLAAPGFGRVPEWRSSGHVVREHVTIGPSYVSGCAALLKAQNPAWGYLEIKEHLLASAKAQPLVSSRDEHVRALSIEHAVLGPIELDHHAPMLTWSALSDATLKWKLRYRSPYCVNVTALYRPHGDEHWRELAYARAGALTMTIHAAALRRSSGVLRIASRESNFHSDEIPLTIR
jgi:hypothetical protein